MTTIIGLDGALAASGLAVWRDGEVSVRTIYTASAWTPEARWAHIGEQLWPIIAKEPQDTLVALEGVFAGKVATITISLAMVQAAIRLGLHYRGIPFVVIDNQAVKMYATSAGRATKKEMIAAAVDRLKLKFLPDEHQADALWLVAMTTDHYGKPMCDMTQAGVKAMERQEWPKWRALAPAVTWR
jgi:Holliday junction resolvasome RuvABC endonuclease subunit